MKKRMLIIPSLLALIILTAFSYPATENVQSYAILSVTSSVDGEEVYFRGKYFDPEETQELNEYLERSKTPFRTKVSNKKFTALFQKLEGKSDLIVKIENVNEGRVTGSVEAKGDVLLLMKEDDWSMSTGL